MEDIMTEENFPYFMLWMMIISLIVILIKIVQKKNKRIKITKKENAFIHFKKYMKENKIKDEINNLYQCEDEKCGLYFRHHQIILHHLRTEEYACPHCYKKIEQDKRTNVFRKVGGEYVLHPIWIANIKIATYDEWLDHHIHCLYLKKVEKNKLLNIFKTAFVRKFIEEENKNEIKYNEKNITANWILNLKIEDNKNKEIDTIIKKMETFLNKV
jgi:hypothetical protein